MMCRRLVWTVILVMGLTLLVGCEEEPAAYDDPFAYCEAVETVDTPGIEYVGPEMPDAIVTAMVAQGIVTADAPPEFQRHAVWRCMDGAVWVCHFGANLPCEEKANMSQEPTEEMVAFCEENPDAEVIPAVATGRATAYEWHCAGGQPQVGRWVMNRDAQGYLMDFWYELAP